MAQELSPAAEQASGSVRQEAPVPPLHEGPARINRRGGPPPPTLAQAPAPQPAQRRWDMPQQSRGSPGARASLQAACTILGNAAAAERAGNAFGAAALAATSRPCYDSRARVLQVLAQAGGFPLLPLVLANVNKMGGRLAHGRVPFRQGLPVALAATTCCSGFPMEPGHGR